MNAVGIIEDVIGNIQNCAAGESDVAALESILAEIAALSKEPAKPEHNCTCPNFNCKACTYQPLPAKLPEVESWVLKNSWVPTGVAPYRVISCDTVRLYLHQLTAAESAKPEPLPEVDTWIKRNLRDGIIGSYFHPADVTNHLNQLTAAHKAAMDEKDATIAKFLDGDCTCTPTETGKHYPGCPISVKDRGRREALAQVPVESLTHAEDLVETQWMDEPDDSIAASIAAHLDAIRKLIESARAAQAEHNNGDKK